MYNNSRNYNTRNSGRYNRPGSFVPASSTNPNHQTFEVPQLAQPVQPAQPVLVPVRAEPSPAQTQPQQDNSIKQEDVEMIPNVETTEEGPSKSRQPFFKTKLSGVKKISNKERRRRQNAFLRRLTSPKNALMCINEMLPNEQITNQFKVEATPQDGLYYNTGTHSFCAELTLDGVSYKGYGENKLAARNAAAEQAIRDIVLKKMERCSDLIAHHTAADGGAAGGAGGADGAAPPGVESLLDAEGGEALPMIQLLSFALHKLFAEWENAGHHVPQLRARLPSQVTSPPGASPPCAAEQAEEVGGGAEGALAPVPALSKPRKQKKVPENASSMHPAMLLTILRPHAAYRELSTEGDKPQNMIFTIAVDTEDHTYIGRAPNKKEARKAAARAACKGILDITFDDEKSSIPTLTSH